MTPLHIGPPAVAAATSLQGATASGAPARKNGSKVAALEEAALEAVAQEAREAGKVKQRENKLFQQTSLPSSSTEFIFR